MLKAVIFDMDGVLIDSEPLWRKAEIQSFKTVNVPLTEDMCRQTTGLRIDEVVEYWFQKYPWQNTSKEKIEDLILQTVVNVIKEEGEMKEGVLEVLNFFKEQNLRIGLASTSKMDLIKAVLEKFQIADYFEALNSAEYEEYGKPHPGVYITVIKKLGLHPEECVAIEDSLNGMLAAKAAKMKCIGIPDTKDSQDKRLGIADVVISSLLQINKEILATLNK